MKQTQSAVSRQQASQLAQINAPIKSKNHKNKSFPEKGATGATNEAIAEFQPILKVQQDATKYNNLQQGATKKSFSQKSTTSTTNQDITAFQPTSNPLQSTTIRYKPLHPLHQNSRN